MTNHSDLIGIGIGPFHLSLASLLPPDIKTRSLFFDQRPEFQWHPELMFEDAEMQTSYLKDLVTPIDPTNQNSFLNYLVQSGLFYAFMNTGRKVVTRKEFEQYCSWVAKNLKEQLSFHSPVYKVDYDGERFCIETSHRTYTSTHLSIATGLRPRIPDCALPLLGENVFHAKSDILKSMDLSQKRVLIIGGGQTGVEIFRNILKGRWGKINSLKLISRRENLEPLDESPFTNEYFHPNYVRDFFPLSQNTKDPILKAQKLASDGNTPSYLNHLYNDLYQLHHVDQTKIDTKILPKRSLLDLKKGPLGYVGLFENTFNGQLEEMAADVIILCTGFTTGLPSFLDPIKYMFSMDNEGRLILDRHFSLQWKGQSKNRIYALNFSRHRHGIAEPQTSLMAWRSATIVNHLTGKPHYNTHHWAPSFIQYGTTNQ